jgi:hypothetical protein
MARLATIGGSGALFVGEDKTFVLSVVDADDVPVNIATWDVKFYVAKTVTGALIFTKDAVVTGSYNVDPTINTQRASVSLTDTELNTVKRGTYQYSFKRMNDGFETVLAYGDFEVEKATAP